MTPTNTSRTPSLVENILVWRSSVWYMPLVYYFLINNLFFSESPKNPLPIVFAMSLALMILPFFYIRYGSGSVGWWQVFFVINTMIGVIVAYALAYKFYGINSSGSNNISKDPVDCIYFSVITWTTLGYGDFSPLGRIGKMISAAEALTGYFSMAGLIAMIQMVIIKKINKAGP